MAPQEEQNIAQQIAVLTGVVNAGFSGVHSRMSRMEDKADARHEQHAERIAVLEDNLTSATRDAAREAVAESVNVATPKKSSIVGWGTAAGTFAVAAFEVVKAVFAAHK